MPVFDGDLVMKMSCMVKLVGMYDFSILDCLINGEMLLFDLVMIGRN